ncbi:hypothetical protein HUB98_24130 [Paenibacillus barcinonensis]|uniref:Uncharacterized protein n=1 Tax=Paenibacillus barcinonensis TaxID=198119 RepID=A0A2V4UZE8_PAEBA|nr:hypothetical protein [Paenibacillus barcinonensis]PYE45567.1 hypothetical protein DFQ00_119115 [Paenibacillus barcinonensis]QKS58992.1 hypothetical protein HUB98_24130 [Paenibacillus barcinonensis]
MKSKHLTPYISVFIAALLLLTAFSQGASAAPESVKQTPTFFSKSALKQGAFGFANLDGTKLLVDYPQEKELNWSQFNLAVGHNGQRLSIKLKGKQKENQENNSFKQTAYNFDNLKGVIYEVVGGKAEPDETYYIVKDSALTDRMLLELTAINKEKPTSKMKSEIAKLKKRAVKNMYPLQNIEKIGNLYLVEYKPKGKDMLASLALLTSDGWVFKDYPAKFSDNSAWRIDDGGSVTPDMFSFTFAARSEHGFILGVQWQGAEGEITLFLEYTQAKKGKNAKKAKISELDVRYGRYTMPT